MVMVTVSVIMVMVTVSVIMVMVTVSVVMVMVTVSVVIVIVSNTVAYISERKYAMVTSVSTIYNRSGKERGAFIGYLPSCCSVYLNKPNCHNGGNIVLSTWAWILIETYGLFSIY